MFENANLISVYTLDDAVADGQLIEVPGEWSSRPTRGLRTVLTRNLHEALAVESDAPSYQSYEGRLNDLLLLASQVLRVMKRRRTNELCYKLSLAMSAAKWKQVRPFTNMYRGCKRARNVGHNVKQADVMIVARLVPTGPYDSTPNLMLGFAGEPD